MRYYNDCVIKKYSEIIKVMGSFPALYKFLNFISVFIFIFYVIYIVSFFSIYFDTKFILTRLLIAIEIYGTWHQTYFIFKHSSTYFHPRLSKLQMQKCVVPNHVILTRLTNVDEFFFCSSNGPCSLTNTLVLLPIS